MVDLELIKKILLVDGISSIDLKGLKLAKKVLTDDGDIDLIRKVFFCDELSDLVDKRMLLDFINYYGIGNIYIGERTDYYSNGQLKLRSMQGKNLLPEMDLSGRKSVFKHDDHDYYYYDLLDESRRCEHVHPDIFYVRDGCDNMKKITSILDKPKENVRRG